MDRVKASFVAGLNWLPRDAAHLDGGEFAREILAPQRVQVDDKTGNKRWAWTKGVDHYYLAEAYDLLARARLGSGIAAGRVVGANKPRESAKYGAW
jgi:hypothetical protein